MHVLLFNKYNTRWEFNTNTLINSGAQYTQSLFLMFPLHKQNIDTYQNIESWNLFVKIKINQTGTGKLYWYLSKK